MKQRGYMMVCSRCGKKEFVVKENRDDDLGGWKALVLKKDDEPFDICPACASLFDRIAELFIDSFNGGILAYTPDGTPIIFDPTLLKPEEKSDEKSDEEIKDSLKRSGIAYLSNLKNVTVHYEVPDFLNKKFNVKKEDDDE